MVATPSYSLLVLLPRSNRPWFTTTVTTPYTSSGVRSTLPCCLVLVAWLEEVLVSTCFAQMGGNSLFLLCVANFAAYIIYLLALYQSNKKSEVISHKSKSKSDFSQKHCIIIIVRHPLTHTSFSIPVTNNIYKQDYRYYLRHCQTTILYGTIHWESPHSPPSDFHIILFSAAGLYMVQSFRYNILGRSLCYPNYSG